MKPLKDQVWCVRDNGTFFCFAQELSKYVGTVLYNTYWNEEYPEVVECVIGRGFPNIHRCDDPFQRIDDIDLWAYPNRGHIGEQLLLESLGKPVFGSRTFTEYEISRSLFRKLQADLGMDTPEYVLIRGITALRKHLMPLEDKWIKIDKFRADRETFHWVNWEQSYMILVYLEGRAGPFAEDMLFLVENTINAIAEVGGDWLICDGKPANKGCSGIEAKDEGYVSFLRTWEELDDTIKDAYEPMLPELAKAGARTFLSTEQRVTKTANVVTDLTPRLGFPSGSCQLKMISNLGPLIWAIANGELIEVEDRAKVCLEAMIRHDEPGTAWRNFKVPDELWDWTNFLQPARKGSVVWTPKGEKGEDSMVGSINGIGDTIEEAYKHLCHNAELLHGQPVCVRLDAIAEVVDDVKEAESAGIELADEPLPETLETE